MALSRKTKNRFALAVAAIACLMVAGAVSAFAADTLAQQHSITAGTSDSKVTLNYDKLASLDQDTAGTVTSMESNLDNSFASGDLYWIGSGLSAEGSAIGNDVLAAGASLNLENVVVGGDVRALAQSVTAESLGVNGIITVGSMNLSLGKNVSAKGIYAYGNDVSFEATTDCLVLYGQNIYFNGTVEGDMDISAQNIVIGDDAVVTGTLRVHSGQVLDIPASAQIAKVDNQSEQNTIDQLSSLRSAIAPFFQVGGVVFTIVSFLLMALIAMWLIGYKLQEACRVVRHHTVKMLLLGLACIVVLPLLVILFLSLVFTIPIAAILVLLVVVSVFCCVPFTGASLGLMLPDRFSRPMRVSAGTIVLGVLLFVPYLQVLVLLGSLMYMFGYIIYTAYYGHDEKHNRREEHVAEAEVAPAQMAK